MKLVTVLTLLVLAAPAAAQKPDSVYRIPGVVVKGTKPVTTVGGSSAVEIRLDSLDLPAAPTFEQVLRQIPLLHVRMNSRGEAEISARGSESRQVAILVDGVPITLAWDSRADASIIPATAPQEIQYVRGLSSMLYGPNVLGGVIDVSVARTSNMPTRTSLVASSGLDHVGAYGANAAVTLPYEAAGGRLVLRGGMGYRNSPGDPLANDIIERAEADDDDLRLNTDYENLDGFVAARYERNSGAFVSFSGSSFNAERGIAAQLGYANADARFWRYPQVRRTLAALSAGTGFFNTPFGQGDLEMSVGYDAGRSSIDQFPDANYATSNGFEDGKDEALTLRLLGDHTLGSRADLRAAFTHSSITHDEILPTGTSVYKQTLYSLGGETVVRLIQGGTSISTLRLTLGGAYDVNTTPEAGGKPPGDDLNEWGARAGLSMGVNGGNTMLHAGASRRGRFPSLRELYSGALNRFAPNPDLKPENLVALEAGVTTALGNGQLQLVGFNHELNDAVVRITLPDRRFLRVNRNQLSTRGIELLASQSFGRVALSGDVTIQKAELTNTEDQQTIKPENVPELFGMLRATLPIFAGFEARGRARYSGTQSCLDPSGASVELDGGTRFDGELTRSWNIRTSQGLFSRIETAIAADNITGTAIYDTCGLPEPGRLFRFQIRLL